MVLFIKIISALKATFFPQPFGLKGDLFLSLPIFKVGLFSKWFNPVNVLFFYLFCLPVLHLFTWSVISQFKNKYNIRNISKYQTSQKIKKLTQWHWYRITSLKALNQSPNYYNIDPCGRTSLYGKIQCDGSAVK